MPFNGSGTYAAPSLPGTWNPAQSGSAIDPTDWNTLLADLATALSKQICNDGQTTITANIPFATRRITGLGNPIGAQDAVTLSFLQATPWSYLGGLTTSRASATTLSVAAGFAVDSTNLIGIPLASAMTKSTAGAWASGNNSNGMGNGLTIANTTWYHVFAIINTGVADVYFDTSVTAANKPTGTTAFRRIGSFKTDGSAQILAFIQDGDDFSWTTPGRDYSSGTNPGTAAITATLTMIPTGLRVKARLQCLVEDTTASGSTVAYFSDLSTTDITPAPASLFDSAQVAATLGNATRATVRADIYTDTSARIRIRAQNSDGGVALAVNTLGWADSRGKNT